MRATAPSPTLPQQRRQRAASGSSVQRCPGSGGLRTIASSGTSSSRSSSSSSDSTAWGRRAAPPPLLLCPSWRRQRPATCAGMADETAVAAAPQQQQSHHQQQQQQQQHRLPFLAGLTGSIGMGKSAVAAMLARAGVPVLCADAVVHDLYAPGGAAVGPVTAAFPAAADGAGGVDRAALGGAVLGDDAAMKRLEGLVHPLVDAARLGFVKQHAAAGAPLVVFDIPLLFETGAERALDAVLVASAPPEAQRARVLARPGMTPEKLDAILGRQLPDADKRARADVVVDTGCSLQETEAQVLRLVAELTARRGEAARGCWQEKRRRRRRALLKRPQQEEKEEEQEEEGR